MFSKEELNALVDEVAAKAEGDHKTVEVEAVIASIKADIIQNIGKQISALALMEIMENVKASKSTTNMRFSGSHVAYQIAEAAEMIMRRAWIEKR